MSKAENIETWVEHKATSYSGSYTPSIRRNASQSTFGAKWMPVISLGFLPLCCAAVFAVQGSPRVFQWIMKIINSLF